MSLAMDEQQIVMESSKIGKPVIQVNQVSKTYITPSGTFTALHDVSLHANTGEFIAVVGKSGSGKSTLMNILTGIDTPTSGEIFIAGEPIHKFNQRQLTMWRGKHVGIVFQFFQLIPTLSVLENVILPMEFCNMYTARERKERAFHLLETVGIEEQANKLPSLMSGGQQQRAAIARALANDPRLLVADEPTGNLDSQTTETIFSLLQGLAESGKTILMVTHNDDIALRANRVLTIKDGRILQTESED